MTNNTPSTGSRGIVGSLRSLMPRRALRFAESLRLAELQASHLLKHLGCEGPPFSDELIEGLPRIRVERRVDLPSHGMTGWSRGWWLIRIRSADTPTRQRFTLAHELKHVLDAGVEDVIYRHLPLGSQPREQQIEAICNYFAACLLMPRLWVKRLWGQGMQSVGTLAWYFEVSPQAMQIRLQTIGLMPPIPRCATVQQLGAPLVRAAGTRRVRRYYRHARMWVEIESLVTALGRAA